MPNFPPGTPNNGTASPVPALAFTPAPHCPTVRIQNTGTAMLYAGGPEVTPVSGFAIAPGNSPLHLDAAPYPVYLCSGISSSSSATTLAAATTAGTTTIVGAGTVPAGYIQVGNGTGTEYAYVATAALTATTSAPLLYDHASGSTVATVVAASTGYSVTAGVV